MKAKPTILQALDDPAIFAGFDDTWKSWRVVLAGVFGLSLQDDELALFQQLTGRTTPPDRPFQEAWIVAGRRAGKSLTASLIAVYLASFRDYTEYLAPGETASLMILAADRRQARTVFGYCKGLFDASPLLSSLVANVTADRIETINRTAVEIHTSSFRSVRGYSLAGLIADEVAFWRDDTSVDPATEVMRAVRPSLATIPESLMLAISSPYSRTGPMWRAYRDHYGKDDAPVLVVQAESRTLNPTLDQTVVDAALRDDPEAATAEWLAEFRSDLETFVGRDVVERLVVPDRHELPPIVGHRYRAFCDPAGGSGQDAMTLAIAHEEDGCAVVDALRERRPPFSPEACVEEFAGVLRAYRVARVVGDRYAGSWPAEAFQRHGITYTPADKPKSDLYREILPALNSHRIELPDDPKLVAQLCSLERRVGRGGRDSIDHPPGAHDDRCNAVCGAALLALKPKRRLRISADALHVSGAPGGQGLDGEPIQQFRPRRDNQLDWPSPHRRS